MSAISNKALWAGRVLSGLAGLFLLVDAVMKFIQPRQVLEATVKLGYPQSTIAGIGAVLLACTVLYLMPRTAALGAVLLTGYLGGAVATHVRAAESVFNVVFSVMFGCLVWAGLWLRDARTRGAVAMSFESR
ncbi:MAG: DoxX family protein [Bryobacteraceae bacterium]